MILLHSIVEQECTHTDRQTDCLLFFVYPIPTSPYTYHINNYPFCSLQPTYWDDAERNQKSAEPLGSQSFPTKPQRKTISISPKRRQSEHPISLRSSPQRHHSDGAMTTGSRSVAASPDTKDWTALRNSISPMSSSQITSAFRSESFDIPPGGFDVLPRGRADSSATMQSRSESLLMDEEQIIAPLDKEVYKEGFIYKKNSTGNSQHHLSLPYSIHHLLFALFCPSPPSIVRSKLKIFFLQDFSGTGNEFILQ